MTSIISFKNKLFPLIRQEFKSFFDIHDPIGIKMLFQLRVGNSHLKSHKKKHNFLDTIDDTCECLTATEDVAHFLFFCPLYATQRISFRRSVSNILYVHNMQHLIYNVETHFYGNHHLNNIANRSILLATISFVKASGRFSNS